MTSGTFAKRSIRTSEPLVEARHMGGVGALHIDEHGIVDRVAGKAAHSGEILPVLIALEQLLDAVFDAVNEMCIRDR